MNKAYWISPKGKSIEVSQTHINSILSNPDEYGLKKSDINKIYKKYGEKLGVEGQARSEVMTGLMKHGWIRIRHIPRQDMWTIQTYYFGNREKNNVWDWIRYARKKNIANQYAELRILIVKSSRVISSSFSEASKGKKIFENLFKEEEESMKLTDMLGDIITETSFSRLWQHLNSNSTFAILSAYLDNKDDELNHKKLAKDIRALGLGFIELESGYSYKTADGDVFASEKSYMIPNITKKKAIKLAEKYEQQSILWKDKDEFVLLGTRSDVGIGVVLMRFKKKGKSVTFDKNTVKTAFSALQKGSRNQVGRKFAFVSELRIKDFPTSYVYQNDTFDEWIKVL